MNTDEALLIADALDPTLDGRGSQTALLVLAREVRRQHAEIEMLENMVDECHEKLEMLIAKHD